MTTAFGLPQRVITQNGELRDFMLKHKNDDSQWNSAFYWNFPFAILIAGALIRAVIYAQNRSLWTDEAQLSLNILNRHFTELGGKLDYCQFAPIGFLFLEKAVTEIFGNSEYSLRLLPLIAGIASLLVFYLIARKFCKSRGCLLLALSLFSFSEPLIRYSVEVKQYSCDLFLSLFLLRSALELHLNNRGLFRFLVLGIVCPWFSISSIFVVIGTSACVLKRFISDRSSGSRVVWSWLVIFALNLLALYKICLEQAAHDKCKAYLDLVPLPLNFHLPVWCVRTLYSVLEFPIGIEGAGVGVASIALFVGLCTLWQSNPRRTEILVSPVVLTLLATAFHAYFFYHRFVLFLCPFFYITIAVGAVTLFSQIRKFRFIVMFTGFLCMFWPSSEAVEWYKSNNEEIKPALRHVMAHRIAGDKMYIYHGAFFPVVYYAIRENWNLQDAFVSIPGYYTHPVLRETIATSTFLRHATNLPSNDSEVIAEQARHELTSQWTMYKQDIDTLPSGRYWVLFARADHELSITKFFLDQRGRQLDSFSTFGVNVFLYDLKKR